MRRTSIYLAAVAVLATGCSAVLGIESDRHVGELVSDGGTGERVEATDAGPRDPWRCLASGPPATPETVRIDLFVNDVVGATKSARGYWGRPVAGGQVHVCGRLDLQCRTPLLLATSDAAGIASVDLPGAFDGFFEVTAPGYSPSLITRPPVVAPETVSASLVNVELLKMGAQLLGIAADDTLGIVVTNALDCDTLAAEGITFDPPRGGTAQLVYNVDAFPSKTATKGSSGLIYNVPPGTIDVTARTDDGRIIRTVSTLVRPGWVTFVQLVPAQAKQLPMNGAP